MTTAYITGASAGLGRAIAKAFAGAGYATGLIARDADALSMLAHELGPKSAWAVADVSDYAQLDSAARHLSEILGPPDIWVNDAMATVFARFEQILPAEFARVMNVTVLGSVHGLQIALRAMKARQHGHIIQIGSALAYRAIPLQAPYCASKFAIRATVDSLRCELIHDGSPIRLTMIHMPAMNTPQFDWARRHIAQFPQPVPPIYSPEACAEAVLWSSRHPNRRELWVAKPTIEAIIGNKLFPAIMDHYMARRAFEGQFEAPAPNSSTDGNLFHTVSEFHTTQGRFTSRQLTEAHWIATSRRTELLTIGALVALVVIGIVLIVMWWLSH